ncbi:MAG: O-antigen ligase family protein [Treponema sp.]|nr:O-antigen ligase family protein [Treponema sp.]
MVVAERLTKVLWYGLCLAFCADSGLFVYLSLSQTLLGGLGVCLLCTVALVHGLRTGTSPAPNGIQRLVVLWLLYMVLHALFVKSPELYRLLYLTETLQLLLALSCLTGSGLLKRETAENGLLLMAVLQTGCLTLQALGAVKAYNSLFPLTGFSENPNVTAVLLAACLPLAADRIRQGRHTALLTAAAVLMTVYVVILGCRTAYLGLAVSVAVRAAFSPRFRKFRSDWSPTVRVLAVLLTLAAVPAGGVWLYRFKQASADGRILVWKISAAMLREHPEGTGIGMFERDYNLRQGEYFAGGQSTPRERQNSGTVYMAYNDFLEHGVEGGWPGMLFLAAFYASLMARALRRGMARELSVIAAFSVMSSVSFICATVQPWIVLVCHAGFVAGGGTDSRRTGTLRFPSRVVLTGALLVLLPVHLTLLSAQIQLGRYQRQAKEGNGIEIGKAEALAGRIGTSEAYYRFLYGQYMQRKEYRKALGSIRKAACYTSVPDVFFSAFDCCDRMGQTGNGIPFLLKVRDMLPLNLTSRLILLRWYERNGQEAAASDMAREILTAPVKVRNRQGDRIRSYAEAFLCRQASEGNRQKDKP